MPSVDHGSGQPCFSRRTLLAGAAALPFASVRAAAETASFSAPEGAREHMIEVPGARLWCWDSGGSGMPILLLHPATGSAAIWEHQYGPLVAVGFRVAAYSRRGHYRSEFAQDTDPGESVADIDAVARALGFKRFVLLGSAAGGFLVPDYALSHPEKLAGIVIACSQGGAIDPTYRATISRILPPGFAQMPASFRELGPSYRAANPAGVARWDALEHVATPNGRVRQRARNQLDWATIGRIRTPALLIAGGADLYMPPTLTRLYASHIPGSKLTVIPEAGHSAYWEDPEAFNGAVIDFVKSL